MEDAHELRNKEGGSSSCGSRGRPSGYPMAWSIATNNMEHPVTVQVDTVSIQHGTGG